MKLDSRSSQKEHISLPTLDTQQAGTNLNSVLDFLGDGVIFTSWIFPSVSNFSPADKKQVAPSHIGLLLQATFQTLWTKDMELN